MNGSHANRPRLGGSKTGAALAVGYERDKNPIWLGLWKRFVREALAAGAVSAAELSAADTAAKRRWLLAAVINTRMRTFQLTHAELGIVSDIVRAGNVRQIQPARPTAAWPGSRAKVETMAERLLRGEELFCSKDAVGDE